MAQDNLERYLPLTESTYYILLALVEPLHGYAVMQRIEGMSEGQVRVGAGTLYNALPLLLKEGLIAQVDEDSRRKYYHLTTKGKAVLLRQIERLVVMARNGQQIRESLG